MVALSETGAAGAVRCDYLARKILTACLHRGSRAVQIVITVDRSGQVQQRVFFADTENFYRVVERMASGPVVDLFFARTTNPLATDHWMLGGGLLRWTETGSPEWARFGALPYFLDPSPVADYRVGPWQWRKVLWSQFMRNDFESHLGGPMRLASSFKNRVYAEK